MKWPRIVLDGISMSLLFNAVMGVGFMLYALGWTLLVCPIAGLAVAGIGSLIP